jgi:signal transduction histidine kinase
VLDINLISNALQALPDRGAGVSVATSFDRAAAHILVTIKDDGKGMNRKVLQRLTEPFFTTRSSEGGTGLGLYIAASIIKEHGGALEFDSKPGRGTTATIRLPAA